MEKTPKNQNLQDLIRDNLQGRSYAELARDCGFANRASVHRLATKAPVDFPSTETLVGLSRGLRVPVGAVIAATAVSVGLDASPYGSSDLVLSKAKTLPQESQELLQSMASQMLWWHEQYERRVDEAENKTAKVSAELERTKSDLEESQSELFFANEKIEDLTKKPAPKYNPVDWSLAADDSASKGDGGDIAHDDLPHNP